MSLWQDLFGREKSGEEVAAKETELSNNIDENLEMFKEVLVDCEDVVYREAFVGVKGAYKVAIVYVDGMANKDLLNKDVLSNLMINARLVDPDPDSIKAKIQELIFDQNLAVTEVREVETLEECVTNMLSGETILLLDDHEKGLIIGSRGFIMRGTSEPVTEAVIRGPRDGFVETARMNTALIRRRIRDPRLKVKVRQIGKRSKTDVAIMYIEDLVNRPALEQVEERLNTIDIDAIIDSGYIEQMIEDNWQTPFPQIQNTERPDSAASALYEGRVVIVVDNSPFVLMVPTTLNSLLQAAEDYYERWTIATAVRILRYIAVVISLLAPAMYVALTSYHPQMIPIDLAIFLGAKRAGVPFPAIVEALIMEVTIEILREAGVRLPGPIGATIGIVGGLVIGQAAVEAGIVAPLMVITVAITAISSFAIPNYNLAISFRLLRFGFIFIAGALGLYGIVLLMLFILVHLCGLKSFGIPYLSPFVNYIDNYTDLKDTFVLLPRTSMRRRNTIAFRKNVNRLKDHRPEKFNKEDNV